MNALATSLLVGGVLVAASLGGVVLRRSLPEHHLDGNARDVVRLGCALVATITGLALGLLINSAKATYEAERASIEQMTANAVLLDHVLDQYGPETRPIRRLLRQAMQSLADRIWGSQESAARRAVGGMYRPSAATTAIFRAIRELRPATEAQRAFQDHALATLAAITQSRLLLHEELGARLPPALLVILVFWLAVLFASFSLFSPLNPVGLGTIVVIALSVSAAIFLILEMYWPFGGLLEIDSAPMRNALPDLGPG